MAEQMSGRRGSSHQRARCLNQILDVNRNDDVNYKSENDEMQEVIGDKDQENESPGCWMNHPLGC